MSLPCHGYSSCARPDRFVAVAVAEPGDITGKWRAQLHVTVRKQAPVAMSQAVAPELSSFIFSLNPPPPVHVAPFFIINTILVYLYITLLNKAIYRLRTAQLYAVHSKHELAVGYNAPHLILPLYINTAAPQALP